MYVKDHIKTFVKKGLSAKKTFRSKALTSAPGEEGERENLGRKAMVLAANEWKNVLTPQVRNGYTQAYKRDLDKL